MNICDFKADSFEKLQESFLVLRCPDSAQNLYYKSQLEGVTQEVRAGLQDEFESKVTE